MPTLDKIKTVTIIGAGSWGTSIAIVIGESKPKLKIKMWAYEKSVVSSINNRRENTQFLPGALIPKNIYATSSLKESLSQSDVVLIATPSKIVYDISQKIKKYITNKTHIGFLTKGFCKVNQEILTISQTISAAIPWSKGKVVAVCGPSHAEEVINKYHTCLNVAGKSEFPRKIIAQLISTSYLQCRETDDIHGVELGGTLKNPAAIAAGMISVLPKCGDNLAGALISEALKEMLLLAKVFNARKETIIDISGLGDLVATALSTHSRNRRFGIDISNQIVKNKKRLDIFERFVLRFKPEDIIEKMSKKFNYLAEGAYAIEPLIELAEKHNIAIPVYRSLYEVLLNKKNPSLLIETIKNPGKYKQIYSRTKIQISERKKGLEKVKGNAYINIIIERTVKKFVQGKDEPAGKKFKRESIIPVLKTFIEEFSSNSSIKLKRRELKIIENLNEKNYENSIKILAKLYVNSITDSFNPIFNRIFVKIMQFSYILNFFTGKKGKITVTGSKDKISQIDESVNIIYVPTYKNYYDFIPLCYAIKKGKFPFPRFFVSKDIVKSARDQWLIKLAGGFIVNPLRMSNPVYKESLCEYISVMIEHGIPLLYFPQHKPEPESISANIKKDFFKMIVESLYKHTIEIVLVPVEISYIEKPPEKISKKITILKNLNNKVIINFSDPIYLSDFTTDHNSVKEINKIIKNVWENDSISNDFGIKLDSDEMIL